MIFSFLEDDNVPFVFMRGNAPEQASIVVESMRSGKNQEELFYPVHHHKNRIFFPDVHIARHAAQNQPKVIETDAWRYPVTLHPSRLFIGFENEGTAASGGN